MKFRDILIWLLIFVVGSLIVYWIIGGGISNTFYDVKSETPIENEKIIDVKSETHIENEKIIDSKEFIQKEISREGIKEELIRVPISLSCDNIKTLSKSEGMTFNEGAKLSCNNVCLFSAYSEFKEYKCENGEFICYCI